MNEIAAYGGFPTRYPHWRFGMEYEQLAKSYEYGLSKIYEMVINNNPSYAYLLEGNSLDDQKLVMAHVYGHVDFFKNNFCFRSTDLDTGGRTVDPVERPSEYDPNRSWIDKMANHGSRVRRARRAARHRQGRGVHRPLPLAREPDRPARAVHAAGAAARAEDDEDEGHRGPAPPRRRTTWRPSSTPRSTSRSSARRSRPRSEKAKKFPEHPERDVLLFLLEHAPLERWERDVLEVIRDEALLLRRRRCRRRS